MAVRPPDARAPTLRFASGGTLGRGRFAHAGRGRTRFTRSAQDDRTDFGREKSHWSLAIQFDLYFRELG